MKRGISVEWMDFNRIEIRKTRGKFTLDEIEEVLRYGKDKRGNSLQGSYAMLLRCTEETCGGNGMYDVPDSGFVGDAVTVYLLNDDDHCPVCQDRLPPHDYCPNCGERWNNDTKTP